MTQTTAGDISQRIHERFEGIAPTVDGNIHLDRIVLAVLEELVDADLIDLELAE